ncbi:Uncharacterised protein [Klebsiella variicola]|uniref:Uncharacterized protein n=1 Tax=Klebsiella variicola TaxID=244366 RepID=A0A7H4MKK6_KLEVA|nr:Uncharacterised protein [Klebsiella variicola]
MVSHSSSCSPKAPIISVWRIVNVGIDKPGQQQLASLIDITLQRMQKGFPLLPWQQRDNFPALQEQQAIIEIAGLAATVIRVSATPAISKNAPRTAVW